MKAISGCLAILIGSCICTVSWAQETLVIITVSNIETDLGVVRVALYDHPDQFPYDPVKKFVLSKNDMKENRLRLTIPGLPEGKYAISLLDDENGNDAMDFNLFHIPREGYGFSNDVRPGLRPPPYEKCTFSVNKGENHIAIRTQYFGKGSQ